jgi:hypothetical protein
LPVLKVVLDDAKKTYLYIDQQEGRVVYKVDASRRALRWLFSAIHRWDFPGLYTRPLWDGWMLTWIGFGLILSVSSVVLAWRRLKRTFAIKAQANAKAEFVKATS